MKNTHSQPIQRIIAALSLLAILAYGWVIANHQTFHQHQHDDPQVCTAEAENDPCHRKVYHHDTTHGCHDDQHLHQQIPDCSLCDVLITPYQEPTLLLPLLQKPDQPQALLSTCQDLFAFEPLLSPNSRGPPVMA